jgi:hypothetical protein
VWNAATLYDQPRCSGARGAKAACPALDAGAGKPRPSEAKRSRQQKKENTSASPAHEKREARARLDRESLTVFLLRLGSGAASSAVVLRAPCGGVWAFDWGFVMQGAIRRYFSVPPRLLSQRILLRRVPLRGCRRRWDCVGAASWHRRRPTGCTAAARAPDGRPARPRRRSVRALPAPRTTCAAAKRCWCTSQARPQRSCTPSWRCWRPARCGRERRSVA